MVGGRERVTTDEERVLRGGSVPHHICTVVRGLQTASQDFPLLSFLPGLRDMAYLSLLIIIIVFFPFFPAFPVDLAIIDII